MKARELFEAKEPDPELLEKIEAIKVNYEQKNHPIGRYKIVDNKIVHSGDKGFEVIPGALDLVSKELMVPFAQAKAFHIDATEIVSFKNFPQKLIGHSEGVVSGLGAIIFSAHSDEHLHLKELTDCPRFIYGDVSFGKMPNMSFASVDKHISVCSGHILISGTYVGPLLGFMRVQQLKKVLAFNLGGRNEELLTATKIIIGHLQGSRSILECQDELLKNGLKEFARK